MAAHPRYGSPLWAGEIARFEPGTAGLQSGVAPNACRIKISQVGWHWVHPPSLSLATGQTLSKTGFFGNVYKDYSTFYLYFTYNAPMLFYGTKHIKSKSSAHSVFGGIKSLA